MKRYIKYFLRLVLAVSLAVLLFQAFDSWNAAQDSAEAFQMGVLSKKEGLEGQSSFVLSDPDWPDPLPEEAAHLAELDVAALQAVNEDVVGWLEIPGTQLSYPLLQGADNQFYLSHNWKRAYSAAGSVFLERTNPRDLSAFHLIAYAHRMRNGTMFGSLRNYSSPDYCREHPRIYLVTLEGVRCYEIFAAHEASITGMVYRLDLEESGLEEDFARFCLNSSVIETGVVPPPGAQILTLSTCTGQGYDTRWVVQGVLTGLYKTAGPSHS